MLVSRCSSVDLLLLLWLFMLMCWLCCIVRLRVCYGGVIYGSLVVMRLVMCCGLGLLSIGGSIVMVVFCLMLMVVVFMCVFSVVCCFVCCICRWLVLCLLWFFMLLSRMGVWLVVCVLCCVCDCWCVCCLCCLCRILCCWWCLCLCSLSSVLVVLCLLCFCVV